MPIISGSDNILMTSMYKSLWTTKQHFHRLYILHLVLVLNMMKTTIFFFLQDIISNNNFIVKTSTVRDSFLHRDSRQASTSDFIHNHHVNVLPFRVKIRKRKFRISTNKWRKKYQLYSKDFKTCLIQDKTKHMLNYKIRYSKGVFYFVYSAWLLLLFLKKKKKGYCRCRIYFNNVPKNSFKVYLIESPSISRVGKMDRFRSATKWKSELEWALDIRRSIDLSFTVSLESFFF